MIVLGRIRGIPITIDVGALVFLALFTFLAAQQAQSFGMPVALYIGLGFAFLSALSILIHEGGHVVAARCFGVRTREIRLHLFGGVAMLEDFPRSSFATIVVSVCGPLTNFVTWFVLEGFVLTNQSANSAVGFTLQTFAVFSLFVGIFNLIPAPPLDGGHVSRAIFLAITKDSLKARRWAGRLGCVVLPLVAIYLLVGRVGSLGGIWTLFLFFQLFMVSLAEARLATPMGALGNRAVVEGTANRAPGRSDIDEALVRATEVARTLGSSAVGTIELLLGVCAFALSHPAKLLAQSGVTYDDLYWVARAVVRDPAALGADPAARAQRIVNEAKREHSGREGVFRRLLDDVDAQLVLRKCALDVDGLRAQAAAAPS